MIVDAETLALVERDRAAARRRASTGSSPSSMESVCEIATDALPRRRRGGRRARRAAPPRLRAAPRSRGCAIGSAGTHPFAMWEDQRIVAAPALPRPRSRRCASSPARSSSSACTCTSGSTTPRRRSTSPTGCASTSRSCSRCRPTRRSGAARTPACMSARTPIFRAFPRVGVPPAYRDWDDYEQRIGFMVESGVMEDYTYLWYDVRPHPKLGTVEIRVCDSQTRVEHTLGLAALIQAMVRELAEHFDEGKPLSDYPWEMLDENKWLAARHGLERRADRPARARAGRRRKELTRRLLDRAASTTPQDLGAADHFEALEDLLARGNGAHRQRVVFEANHDLREVMAEIVAAHDARRAGPGVTRPAGTASAPLSSTGMASSPELFVVCKNCNSQVSPYITECPYCGTAAAQAGAEDRARRTSEAARRRSAAQVPHAGPRAAADRRDPRHPRRRAAPAGDDDHARGDRPAVVAGDHPARGRGLPDRRSTRSASGGSVLTAPVRALQRLVPVRRARARDRPRSAGCSSAATAPLVVLVTWLLGASGGMAVVKAVEGDVARRRRQRRRAGAAVRLGGPAAARAAARARRGRRATCSARRSSSCCSRSCRWRGVEVSEIADGRPASVAGCLVGPRCSRASAHADRPGLARRRAGRSARPGMRAAAPPRAGRRRSSRRTPASARSGRGRRRTSRSRSAYSRLRRVPPAIARSPRAAGRGRPRSRGPRSASTSAAQPLASASSCRWPSSPKPVTSVSACAPARARGARRPSRVQRRHDRRPRARRARPAASPRLAAVLTAPAPSGLVRKSTSPGRPPAFVSTSSGWTVPGDRQAVLRLGVVDRVAADDRRARRLDHVVAAAQDLPQHLAAERLEREGHEVQRAERRAAHRVDVARARSSPRCGRSRTGRRRSA